MRLLKQPKGYITTWLLVIGISLTGSYFNSFLFGAQFHLKQELPFIARWLVWMPLTPLAVAWAEKVNYTGSRTGNFLLYHSGVYIVLCAVHVFAASALSRLITSGLGGQVEYLIVLKRCALNGVFFNFITYAVIVLLINGYRYNEALQAEKIKTAELDRSLTESRLSFLKQQLQPHFLFNAHHSVITLVKLGENEKAAVMLGKLSDLMRAALRETDGQVVSLNSELETLKLYVDIQQVRFEDKMSVVYDIAESAGSALVPGMILQPLVENSIKHGVERSAGASRISVSAFHENDMLKLRVQDRVMSRLSASGIRPGIGLSNSVERLKRLYGPAASLSMLPYQDNEYSGMQVTITIPLQYA